LAKVLQFIDLFNAITRERLMFNDKSFLRSNTYFQMQQLCRIFFSAIEETIRDMEENQEQTLPQIRNQPSKRENFNRDFEALSTEWDKHKADPIAKLTVILDLVRKGRSNELTGWSK
jgi:hypothetical protein